MSTFPSETCEKVQDGYIAQPYSAFINILICIILLYFIKKTKNKYGFAFLLSFFVFQALHTMSHIKHINNNIQTTLVHIMAIITNIVFLCFYFHVYGKINVDLLSWIILILLIDIYMFITKYPLLYTIFTQILIFVIILLQFYNILHQTKKELLEILIILSIVIFSLLLNEKQNGERLLHKYPDFPFHMAIEITGLGLIYVMCMIFYDVSSSM